MRILHLSDVHLPEMEIPVPQSKVIAALCNDIKKISKEKTVDLIAFSGDIASKGGTSNGFVETALTKLFNPLLQCFEKSPPIIICPGNHDVNLGARDEIYNPIFNAVASPEAANNAFAKISDKPTPLLDHLSGYLELAKSIDPSAYSSNPFFYTKKIGISGVSIGVASLNSAWLTKGGGNGDYGQLFIGEQQIDAALAEIKECTIKIAVMHHTFKWLNPSEGSVVQRLLASNFHAVLCGHNHENNATGIFGNFGSIFISNTGCLYETREYFNGYSIVDLDLDQKKWVVNAREYYFQRDQFSVSTRFSENGIHEYLFKSEPGSNIVVIPSTVISEIQERASSKLLSFAASEVAPKQVGAMFVEPPIAALDEKQFLDGKSASEQNYLSLPELSCMEESLLIVGKRESGKTLLLHEIAANRFMEFSSDARIGVVVDLSTISKQTEASILQQMVEATGSEIRRKDMIDLLTDGRVLVCFDNFTNNPKQIGLIREFCKKSPKVRYILGAAEEFHTSLTMSDPLPDIGVPLRRLFIHSFRRKHVKEMVKKWFGDEPSETNIKFELVNQLLNQLNVPTTPFLVSVLLWVIEQRPNASPVNQAAAIEVLIEGLIEKLQESKSRVTFDSNIQMHFLSDLAVHLDSTDVEWIPAIDFDAFVVNYFQKKGLQVSTNGFADELFRKGLLYSTLDTVAFKFDCFRAYFLAERFSETNGLWQKALNQDYIHRYTTEIDLFTGLHRDKREVLETSLALCQDLFEAANLNIDLNEIDKIASVSQIISPNGIDKLEVDLLENDYDERHREAHLDKMERPSDASVDHSIARRRNQLERSSDELIFLAALRTLSVVVRNSELVDDVELKQRALTAALDYWAKLIISALDLTTRVDFSEVGLPEVFTQTQPEKRRQLMILLLPQAIISMMSECLATPKLQSFLAKASTARESIIPTLASLMSLESGEKDSPAMVKNVLQRFGSNKIIAQIVFFKLLHVYWINNLSRAQANGIRECLAEAFTIFRDAPAKQRAAEKSQFLANLDRRRELNDFTGKSQR